MTHLDRTGIHFTAAPGEPIAPGASSLSGEPVAPGPYLPFIIPFSLADGRSPDRPSTRRRLSQMRGMYADAAAEASMLAAGDPLVYEFYELDIPEQPGHLRFGTSIIYPGQVGREYFMTKGHFHQILTTAEVYYCLQGSGFMLMETPEGDTAAAPLQPGDALYVPPRWAHRSINTGQAPLVIFYTFASEAGHDYGTIERKGFRRLIVADEDGQSAIIDNPRWQ